MKYIIFLILTLILTTTGVIACKPLYTLTEAVLIEDAIQSAGINATCNISIYRNNVLNQSGAMLQNGLSYNYSAGILAQDVYTSFIECNKANSTYLGSCDFIVSKSEGQRMVEAIIILLPLFMAILFIWIGTTMSQEHTGMKIFLTLLGILFIVPSVWFGSIALNGTAAELTTAMMYFIFINIIIFAVLIGYWVIMFIVWAFNYMAQRKEGKLNY